MEAINYEQIWVDSESKTKCECCGDEHVVGTRQSVTLGELKVCQDCKTDTEWDTCADCGKRVDICECE